MLTPAQLEDALEELFLWDRLEADTEEHARQIAEAAARSGHAVIHGRDGKTWFVKLVHHRDYLHLGEKM